MFDLAEVFKKTKVVPYVKFAFCSCNTLIS